MYGDLSLDELQELIDEEVAILGAIEEIDIETLDELHRYQYIIKLFKQMILVAKIKKTYHQKLYRQYLEEYSRLRQLLRDFTNDILIPKEYEQMNLGTVRERDKIRHRIRYHTDPEFREYTVLRSRVYKHADEYKVGDYI